MGILDAYYCPDTKCTHRKAGKKGQHCPECGAQMEKFGVNEATQLRSEKKVQQKIKEDPNYAAKIEEKKEQAIKKAIIHTDHTEEEIIENIQEDIRNLAMHEAGTKWMRIGTLLSLNSTEQMIGAGFKAIIDQNKILIRQNELILRELREKKKDPSNTQ